MKKYSFLVYHKEYDSFLQSLQDLGVLHVIEKELEDIEDENLRDKYALVAQFDNAVKFLEKRNIEAAKTKEGDGLKVLGELQMLQKESERYNQQLVILDKEIASITPWGEFNWSNIDQLRDAGINVRFLIAPQRKFDEEIKDNFYVEEINSESGHVYFILLEKEEAVEIDTEEAQLPDKSLSELKKLREEVIAILDKNNELLDDYASKYIPLLKKSKQEVNGQLAFDLVKQNTTVEAEDKLMVLEGWTPVDNEEALNNFLDNSGVYYEIAAPDTEEHPPIKLKNNRFARLYEAIGELYTFPNYGELDLTPFFAPFYMLFFGFCLGDAGYGLLITLGCIYGLFKVKEKIKPLLKLGMYLGIATTIMGIVGGTFFGILLHPENHEAGKTFSPFITKYQEYIVSQDNLMITALVIGYIQVLFGMFLKAANRIRLYGFKYAISQFGWNIIALVTIPATLLTFMANILDPAIGKQIILVSGIIGGIPAFFYNTPGKNPLLNLGTGLWEAYGVASGLLGDVLSYIRLFALGLSSAILGNVFNQLAMQSSDGIGGGIIGFLIMAVILAFGHGLNFFMAALGSFVHPLRLTFVEFYKNAGFMGGGKKYEPFSK